MIPERLGLFWAGGPLSWLRYMTVRSFRKYNPDWEIVVYTGMPTDRIFWKTGESQEGNQHKGKDYFEMLEELDVKIEKWKSEIDIASLSPVHQSDLFAWWFLHEVGGIYSDFDILFVQSLHKFCVAIKKYDSFLMSMSHSVPIGFMGGSEGNKIFRDLYKTCLGANRSKYQSLGCHAIYRLAKHEHIFDIKSGSDIIAKLMCTYPEQCLVDISEKFTVYPWDWNKVHCIFQQLNKVSEEVLGIHWFAGGSLGQEFNVRLTEGNFRQRENKYSTLVDYIRRVYED